MRDSRIEDRSPAISLTSVPTNRQTPLPSLIAIKRWQSLLSHLPHHLPPILSFIPLIDGDQTKSFDGGQSGFVWRASAAFLRYSAANKQTNAIIKSASQFHAFMHVAFAYYLHLLRPIHLLQVCTVCFKSPQLFASILYALCASRKASPILLQTIVVVVLVLCI